jgi:DNA-binding CsgD family transcriptional regulator
MHSTNKYSSCPKSKVLALILCVFISAMSFTASASSFGIYSENQGSIQTHADNNTEKTYLNLSKNETYDNSTIAQNPNLANSNQLSALLMMIIILLVFLTFFLWRRNIALGYENLQAKSKLDQYLTATSSDEALKLIQDEHKQQALILNERQQKIVDLMAFGYSNKQIADKLFISENTVKYHIKNIYHVLHVKDRKALWLSQN